MSLDLSKIDAGHMGIRAVPVAPCFVIERSASMLGPTAAAKGIRFETSCDSSVPELVEVDPIRLRQILVNLVNNAVKFTNTGSVDVKVSWAAGPAVRRRLRHRGRGSTLPCTRRSSRASSRGILPILAGMGGPGWVWPSAASSRA